MSRINVTSEPPSGCDTPIHTQRFSDETLNTLNAVTQKLQQQQAKSGNPRKRAKPSSSTTSDQNQGYTDTREQYPAAAKPIYLRLKGLYRKKLSLASNVKIMEGKLSKNCYPTSLDFKFNFNSTRNPILKDKWIRAIRNCKTEMTLALIEDMQKAYNQTKASIAKKLADLETILNPAQFKEINDSLTTRFKQMVHV